MARETVPNPFGGRNSVLKVASSPEAAHLADAEDLPLKTPTNRDEEKYGETVDSGARQSHR
jgi:hypothetical protein